MNMAVTSPKLLHDIRSYFISSFASAFLLIATSVSFYGLASAQETPPAFELSSSEKAWLAAHPDIRLAIDIDWAPFEFVDNENQYRGMAAEYIRLVEQRLGITLMIDKQRPWDKMVEAVKNHDLDAFSLVVRTPQRDAYLNFTKPYMSFPMVIVTLDEEPFIDGIEALHNRVVGVVKSYASHDLLTRNHPDLQLRPSQNVRKGLEAVSNGQTYAFVGNLAVVGQVIRDEGLSNLKISGQTPYRFELSMAARKDWPELIPILQKALDSISIEERDAIYDRWIRLTFHEEVDYRLIFLILAGASMIVFVIYSRNRKLRREMDLRHDVEIALKESEEKYRAMFTSANVGLALCKMDGTLLDVNEGYCQILGRSKRETLALTYWDITPSAYAPQEALQLESLKKDGKYGPYEKEYLRYDGTTIPVLLNGSLIQTAKGEDLIWSVVHDISDRKKSEEKALSAMVKAKEASRAKSEFLANMSHELRTPLNAIVGFSEALIHQTFGPLGSVKNLTSVSSINEAGKHLTEIISDILDISKIEASVLDVDEEAIVPLDIVTEAIRMIRPDANKRSITILKECPEESPGLRADRVRVKQVLLNLLSNAIKFTPEGGSITVQTAFDDDGCHVFSISDTGIGIEDADVSKVLEPFGQVAESFKRNHGGTGLGLPICDSLMKLHGGTLTLESKIGRGTTVTVRFPPERTMTAEATETGHPR